MGARAGERPPSAPTQLLAPFSPQSFLFPDTNVIYEHSPMTHTLLQAQNIATHSPSRYLAFVFPDSSVRLPQFELPQKCSLTNLKAASQNNFVFTNKQHAKSQHRLLTSKLPVPPSPIPLSASFLACAGDLSSGFGSECRLFASLSV